MLRRRTFKLSEIRTYGRGVKELMWQYDSAKHYGYEGELPISCPLCGGRHPYMGHLHAMGLGVQCWNCGIKLCVDYGIFKCNMGSKRIREKKEGHINYGYDRFLLEEAIYMWNNKGKERGKRIKPIRTRKL